MRAISLTLPALLALSECTSERASERGFSAPSAVATASSTTLDLAPGADPAPSASIAISADGSSTASASASASAAAPALPESVCALPAKRPADFGVKILRHIMPHGGPDRWEGLELHQKGRPCPADGSGVTAPCRQVSAAALDDIYNLLARSKFCSLRHKVPSPVVSPHYGLRSIAVYVGGRRFGVADSNGALLDDASSKRFYAIVDAAVQVVEEP